MWGYGHRISVFDIQFQNNDLGNAGEVTILTFLKILSQMVFDLVTDCIQMGDKYVYNLVTIGMMFGEKLLVIWSQMPGTKYFCFMCLIQ